MEAVGIASSTHDSKIKMQRNRKYIYNLGETKLLVKGTPHLDKLVKKTLLLIHWDTVGSTKNICVNLQILDQAQPFSPDSKRLQTKCV